MVERNPPDAALSKILPRQELQPGVTYVSSQFVLSFEHGGKRYAYHTLTRQLLETELIDSFERNTEKEALIRGLFLVPEGKDECAYYQSVSSLMRTLSHKKGNRSFMILPTLACNARCVYCYEEGAKPVTMTDEIADETARYIAETHADEPVHINWFGGEPLLRPDVIDRVLSGLRDAGVPYRCGMVSNGSLITPEIITKMKGLWNVTGIQISVDGCERDYIARKRYVSYHDYYHTVMEAISRMSEAGIGVIIRCNSDESSLTGAGQFLADLADGVAHKENVKLYFTPLHSVRAGKNAYAVWEKILALRPLIEAAGIEPYYQHSSILKFNVHHCMADGDCAVIGPDGRLYPCEHCDAETCFGDVFNGTTNEAVRTAFCRTDVTLEKCRTCTFLPCCTSFSSCPVKEADCRRTRTLLMTDALKRFIDKQEIEADGEVPDC